MLMRASEERPEHHAPERDGGEELHLVEPARALDGPGDGGWPR